MTTIITRRAKCPIPVVRIQSRNISWRQHQLDLLDAEKQGFLRPPPTGVPSPFLWRIAQLSSFYLKSIPVALHKGGKESLKVIPFVSLLPLVLLGKYPQTLIPTPCLLPAQASRRYSYPSRADLQAAHSAFVAIVHDPKKWPRPIAPSVNPFKDMSITPHQAKFFTEHSEVLLHLFKSRAPQLVMSIISLDWETRFMMLKTIGRATQLENADIRDDAIDLDEIGEEFLDRLLSDRGIPPYAFPQVFVSVAEKRKVLEWCIGDGTEGAEKIFEKALQFASEFRV